MVRVSIVAVLVLAASPVANATPPACERWHNQLTACEAAGFQPGCVLLGDQLEKANSVLYSSSALQACKNLIQKSKPAPFGYTPGKEIRACRFGPTNTCLEPDETTEIAYCDYDIDGDGDIDWDDASRIGRTVAIESVNPDPMCYCTPHGPYTGMHWTPPAEGTWDFWQIVEWHRFTRALKAMILAANWATGGSVTYHSDVTFDPEPLLQKDDINAPDAAEIDHIIPRVDSHGCLCGEAAPNNAAVISRLMNGAMSNTSPHWSQYRSLMFQAFVSCPDPRTAEYMGVDKNVGPPPLVSIGLEEAQVDESSFEADVGSPPVPSKTRARLAPRSEDATSGGCSAGGGVGVAGVLGVLVVLVGRRRARIATRS